MNGYSKHEIIGCDRCGTTFECKANSFTRCQCSTVPLNLNETQYISEQFDGCLCAKCLLQLQQEFAEQIK
ncbi:cysteine-rich CWC family protein [Mucilaginibacter sp. HMF5004]|uniref:cysteine-rich CWC family protein n=1 Tax=Mucilaginibacter rivuli TaxID=2857527 RepID=UPI001C5D6216|nr:cysteine-rich CWC family protein [Mucilaginibacter rivuli]MBW4889539.1 cysteine-rich CWC family protein [Mucilaginibacter rivuli]